MVLSGLALAFSRLIDDSVVVIENVYRHIEMGEDPKVAAVKGANEVALAVLAIMLVAVVVFFPVTFLFGVSKDLFTALALGVVLALFASYFDAVTVVPLFCANFLKAAHHHEARRGRRQAIVGREIPPAIQRQIRDDAQFLREMGTPRFGSPKAGTHRVPDLLLRLLSADPVCRFVILPAHRCRPIRH